MVLKHSKAGLTMIELIIVIAITIVLAGAMVPLFSVNKKEAAVLTALSEMDAIKTAELLLQADTGQFSLTTVGSTVSADGLVNAGGISGWKGPYLDRYNKDPWGGAFKRRITTGGLFTISSNGPDRIEGGGDDIVITISPSAL